MSGFAPRSASAHTAAPWVRWARDAVFASPSAPPPGDVPFDAIRAWRVEALVYAALAAAGDPRRAALAAAAQAVAASNLLRPAAMRDALRPLDERGIRYVVFKGAAMVLAHPDLAGVRAVSDADVLVAPGDRRAATRVLLDTGFRRHDPPEPVSRWWNNEATFLRQGPPELFVDLHRGLHRAPLFERLSALALRSGRRVDGLWVASDAVAPLLVAAHRAKHGYSGDARELLDLHLLLERLPETDVAALPLLARDTEVVGALYCAWTLARWWFGHGTMAAEAAYSRLVELAGPWRDALDLLASMDSPSDADKPWRAAPFLKMYLPMPLLTGHPLAALRLAAVHAVLRGADAAIAGPGVLGAVAARRVLGPPLGD